MMDSGRSSATSMTADCSGELIDPASPISVVIPTYNRMSTLPRALESVAAQSCKPRQVIVIDDASTDDTEQRLAPFLARGVIYRRHSRNRGTSAARNTGAALCDGDVIAFLDSDDELQQNNFAERLDALRRGGEACVLAYCPSLIIGKKVRIVVDTLTPEAWNRPFFDCNFVGGASQCMVNAAAFRAVSGFNERLAVAEDWDLWLRLRRCGHFAFAGNTFVIRHADSNERLSNHWTKRLAGLRHIYATYARPAERAADTLGSELALEIGDTFFHLRRRKWARIAYRRSLAGERRSRVMLSLALTYLPITAAQHVRFVWFLSGLKTRLRSALDGQNACLSPFKMLPKNTQ